MEMADDETPTTPEPAAEVPAAPAPPPPPTAARPTRLWPASTVVAAAVSLALLSGLIGGVVGFAAGSHSERIGIARLEGAFTRGPSDRHPDFGQRWQQFQQNHPGIRPYQRSSPGTTG
jgi:hypothetical protein